MHDYQRTVEFLRDFRASQVQAVTDEVRQAAATYAELCATANERLRQCHLLLQRGLRAEAVHLADASPNLLDLVAALDLPDPEGWIELCQRADMPVPPPLQIDRAAQLNDAYGQDEPLAQLYATHRRLALSHGPLAHRLDVLRQLAQADPSAFWDKDIRVFEQARFKQMRLQFANAISSKDTEGLKSLAAELLDSPWIEQPPQDLASAARDVHDRVQLAKAGTDLMAAIEELRVAYAAKSLTRTNAALAKVKEIGQVHGAASMSMEAANEIKTIAAWAQKQEQSREARKAHQALCDALSQAIDSGAKSGALEAAYRPVFEHNLGVPPELQQRYEALLARRSRAAWMMYAAGFAVLFIGVGVAAWIIREQGQAQQAQEWARRIEAAVTQKNVSLAKQLVDEQQKLAPHFNDSASVAAAKKKVQDLAESITRERSQTDQDRQAIGAAYDRLEAAVQSAGQAIQATDSTPDSLTNAATAADNALARGQSDLAELRKIDSENRLAPMITRLEGRRDKLRELASAWVITKAGSASRSAAGVRIEPTHTSLSDADTQLAAAEKELSETRPFISRASAEARSAVDAAYSQITAKRTAITTARAEYDARQTLITQATTIAAARTALRDFTTRFPDSPLCPDFLSASTQAAGCEAILAWQTLAASWMTSPFPAGEKAMNQRLSEVRTYLAAHPASPISRQIGDYAAFIEAGLGATREDNAWQESLGNILQMPLMSSVRCLTASDGTRYWILGDPALKVQGPLGRLRYEFQAIDPLNVARTRLVKVGPPLSLVSERATPAQHVPYARALAEQLKAVDADRWDLWGVDLIEAVAREETLDPVVKGILLRETIRATAKVTHWAVGGLYDRVLADLDRQKLDTVIWYDHENPVPEVLVTNLKAIFQRIPKTEEARRLLAARRQELSQIMRPAYAGIGLLMKDDQGKWQILTPPGGRIGETAATSIPAPAAAPGAWLPMDHRPNEPIEGIAMAQATRRTGPGTLFQMPPATTRPAAAPTRTPATQPTVATQPAPATQPATQPATFVPLPPTPIANPTVPVPAPAAVPPPPTITTNLVIVARRKDGKMVVDEAAVRLLPQGTVVLFSQP